jgi:hypothetical protein
MELCSGVHSRAMPAAQYIHRDTPSNRFRVSLRRPSTASRLLSPQGKDCQHGWDDAVSVSEERDRSRVIPGRSTRGNGIDIILLRPFQRHATAVTPPVQCVRLRGVEPVPGRVHPIGRPARR